MIKQDKDESWMYDVWLGGRKGSRKRKNGFRSEQDARDALAVLRADYKRQMILPVVKVSSLQEVRDRWIDRLTKKNRSEQHIRLAERAFQVFAEIIPMEQATTNVKPDHLGELVLKREQGGVSRETAFLDVIQIRAALRFAAGRMPGLEAWSAPDIPDDIERPRSKREREFNHDEESRLIAAFMDEGDLAAADFFQIAIDTGMRVGEIFRLQWSDVHTESSRFSPHGWLMVHATKIVKRKAGETESRKVRMTARVAMVLASRRGAGQFVFGEKFDHDAKLEKACKRAKIPYGRKTENGVVFHDTRHTAISRMLRAGADPRSVMDLVGHKVISTTMKYAHSTEESRARAIEALEVKE